MTKDILARWEFLPGREVLKHNTILYGHDYAKSSDSLAESKTLITGPEFISSDIPFKERADPRLQEL